MQEQAPTPTQPPHDLLQYPEANGVIPLVERYTEPGATINWEENPYTKTKPGDENNPDGDVSHRRAIIAAYGGAVYYLHGDTIYGFDPHTPAHVREIHFTDRTPFPESVTIGEEAPFSGDYAIKEVLVAADAVAAGDKRSDKHLQDAHPATENLFEYYERIIQVANTEKIHRQFQAAQEAASAQKMAEFDGARVQRPDENGYGQGYTFKDKRMWEITSDDRNSSVNRHDPQGDNEVHLGVHAPDAPAPTPDESTRSHHGTLISPPTSRYSSYQEGSGGKEYKPRMSYYVDNFPKKVGGVAWKLARHPVAESRRAGSALGAAARAIAAEVKPTGSSKNKNGPGSGNNGEQHPPKPEETIWGSAKALAQEIADGQGETWEETKEQVTLLLLTSSLLGKAALRRVQSSSSSETNTNEQASAPDTAANTKDKGGWFESTYIGAFWHAMGKETVESYWKKAKNLTRDLKKR
jgi:hypothetical protein